MKLAASEEMCTYVCWPCSHLPPNFHHCNMEAGTAWYVFSGAWCNQLQLKISWFRMYICHVCLTNNASSGDMCACWPHSHLPPSFSSLAIRKVHILRRMTKSAATQTLAVIELLLHDCFKCIRMVFKV